MQVSSEKPMPTRGNNFHWVNFLIVFGRDWIVLAYTEGKVVQDERNVRARTQIIRAEQSHNTSPQHSTAERATHFSNPDAFQQRQNLVPLSSYFLNIYFHLFIWQILIVTPFALLNSPRNCLWMFELLFSLHLIRVQSHKMSKFFFTLYVPSKLISMKLVLSLLLVIAFKVTIEVEVHSQHIFCLQGPEHAGSLGGGNGMSERRRETNDSNDFNPFRSRSHMDYQPSALQPHPEEGESVSLKFQALNRSFKEFQDHGG